MRCCDLIEELVVGKYSLTDANKNLILNSYSQHEWTQTAQVFLKGIGNQHQVPGRQVYQLWDICDQQQHQELTRDQMWLMFHILLEYWNQISCESRAQLML